ncbi:BQ5605_C003g02444 [Microbotryum silenes-dioicae]|uniref:BQ5605_C003g02444 protein n=1 Tax=Microbotryum silenes-dioicae TaxID=796604 RepID=A0A2X0M565_9BASI|nr:BQ5605_C003g02444 [Microbotryum silenes-dioicae]
MGVVDLFGGAITTTYPSNLTDASDVRQVPDTQEVYLSNDSDLSLILEVLQLVEEEGSGESLEAGIRYHFASLAHDNEALSYSIDSTSQPTTTSPHPLLQGPITLLGTQSISKFNKPASQADQVTVFLALWRIPEKKTDLVLTVNWPNVVFDEEGKASDQSEGVGRAKKAFEEAVKDLKVVDWGLFAV